jgi:hypothetical protein
VRCSGSKSWVSRYGSNCCRKCWPKVSTMKRWLSGSAQLCLALTRANPHYSNTLSCDAKCFVTSMQSYRSGTHAVRVVRGARRWHLGFMTEDYLPTSRGFSRFYGFLTGKEDYFTHTDMEYNCAGHSSLRAAPFECANVTSNRGPGAYFGLDLYANTTLDRTQSGRCVQHASQDYCLEDYCLEDYYWSYSGTTRISSPLRQSLCSRRVTPIAPPFCIWPTTPCGTI